MEGDPENSGSVEPRADVGATSAPWSARPGETARAYEVFRHWLKGDRSKRRLADAVVFAGHTNARTVEGWSSKHEWKARARAYDEHRDDRVDAAAVEEREVLMRKMVRDRVAYQRSFHDALDGMGRILKDIADDPDQPGSARIAAVRTLIEQSGFNPVTPPDEQEGIGELVVAEILRMASALPPDEGDVFTKLVLKASATRELQRAAEAGHEAD